MIRTTLTSLSILAGLAGPVAMAQERSGAADGGACPVLESGGWSAWIDAEPGPGAGRRLIIEGEATLPTPGFEPRWAVGPADRRLPPAQHLDLSFDAPDGIVIQALTPQRLRFETPAVHPAYRAVVIRCGGRTLARIEDVPEAR